MTSRKTVVDKDSVDAEASKYRDDSEYAVDDEAELRPTVELETQAKVDTNHPDTQTESLTLEDEERFAAREMEIGRTRQRLDDRQQSSRERRTREVARDGSCERRRKFQERAASVDPRQAPADPRSRLTRDQVAAVNEQAARLVEEVDGWSRAAIARRLAGRVLAGADLSRAVLDVVEGCQREPGTVVPIAAVPDVDRATVSIEGEIVQLWETDHPAIAQSGLIADETDTIKFTVWVKSRKRPVTEGDQVVLRGAQKSWYQDRCSVAVTGSTLVTIRK